MACTTGKVSRAAEKTVKAQAQVEKLASTLEDEKNKIETLFFSEIDSSFAAANIGDGRQVAYNHDIKTEYTSEFSLDKIAGVVVSVLKAAKAATDPTSPNPATSPEALDAYADVVSSVAEAAKSTSKSAASLSFSMNRLAPGLYVFLYARSVNIYDEDTFGSEAVTSTAIYYRLMESIDDIKNEAAFGAARIDAASYLQFKALQAALIDELASGSLSIDTYSDKDAKYQKIISTLKGRLDAAGFPVGVALAAKPGEPDVHAAAFAQFSLVGPSANARVVHRALSVLATKGKEYQPVVEKAQARLAEGYY